VDEEGLPPVWLSTLLSGLTRLRHLYIPHAGVSHGQEPVELPWLPSLTSLSVDALNPPTFEFLKLSLRRMSRIDFGTIMVDFAREDGTRAMLAGITTLSNASSKVHLGIRSGTYDDGAQTLAFMEDDVMAAKTRYGGTPTP